MYENAPSDISVDFGREMTMFEHLDEGKGGRAPGVPDYSLESELARHSTGTIGLAEVDRLRPADE